MTEKPILFNGEMVRQILNGRKTQTRRIIKPQPNEFGLSMWPDGSRWLTVEGYPAKCPYGQPGDKLWVKETFCDGRGLDIARPEDGITSTGAPAPQWIYRADEKFQLPNGTHWKPSIFMPRDASRITLEITKIRVERLQDISEEDAKAEGIDWRDGDLCKPQTRYKQLWESINGLDSWKENPWVWCISFRRI